MNPIPLIDLLAQHRYRLGEFPVSEQESARILSLPLFPEMDEDQVIQVADLAKSV